MVEEKGASMNEVWDNDQTHSSGKGEQFKQASKGYGTLTHVCE